MFHFFRYPSKPSIMRTMFFWTRVKERMVCVGKKNWQMIDTINEAKTLAIIYSIVETAKANNLKPYDYARHLLEKYQNIWMMQIVYLSKKLLPTFWQKSENHNWRWRRKQPPKNWRYSLFGVCVYSGEPPLDNRTTRTRYLEQSFHEYGIIIIHSWLSAYDREISRWGCFILGEFKRKWLHNLWN